MSIFVLISVLYCLCIATMQAFTLVETLVVLGLLSLIIAGGLVVGSSAHSGALRQQTYALLASTAASLEATRAQTGIYPATLAIDDPWGTPLVYTPTPDGLFSLSSTGPDGLPHTSDDITYAP